MATAPAPNPRASLLSGLRTGGVRSTSGNFPHTAAIGGSFNVPHFAQDNDIRFQVDGPPDDVPDLPNHGNSLYMGTNRHAPMTAAVDGSNNRFQQQQQYQAGPQRGLNVNSQPFNPANMPSHEAQAQAMQMQMMQIEILRLQAIQAQQYQAELFAQNQRLQQSQQAQNRRASFNPPATAGPLTSSFGVNAQRRPSHAEQLKSQLGVSGHNDQVPMTAALGGKFGGRAFSLSDGGKFGGEVDDVPPSTPGHTTVISGGTSLGNPSSNNIGLSTPLTASFTPPSKSDSASSWRRGGNNNSVLSGNRSVTMSGGSPSVKVTPPPGERVSPPPFNKTRPQPLRFNLAASLPTSEVVAIDQDAGDAEDGASTASSKSAQSSSHGSSPTTPHSASSHHSNEVPPLSPREEAAKKLYEGLGIGRPVPVSTANHRMASQPTRQPRGPPSGADELGPKNFATRIRRKAIGGLSTLMAGRERREFIEAY
ncbi:hypothetical protein PLICRDRAFT_26127 [Plicaturopsis crispa FD-325 SS-3]|nr:hypothetical protein PLICRDRAFT_26127 [Plicaturopsis crispa FD-325 SS-3]